MDHPRHDPQEGDRDGTVQDADGGGIHPLMAEVRTVPFRDRNMNRIQDTSRTQPEEPRIDPVHLPRARAVRGDQNRFYLPVPSPQDMNDQNLQARPQPDPRNATRSISSEYRPPPRHDRRTLSAASPRPPGTGDHLVNRNPHVDHDRSRSPPRFAFSPAAINASELGATNRSSDHTGSQLTMPKQNARRGSTSTAARNRLSSIFSDQENGPTTGTDRDIPRQQRRENQQPGQSPFSSGSLPLSGNNNSVDLYNSNQNWMDVYAAHNQRQGRNQRQETIQRQEMSRLDGSNYSRERCSSTSQEMNQRQEMVMSVDHYPRERRGSLTEIFGQRQEMGQYPREGRGSVSEGFGQEMIQRQEQSRMNADQYPTERRGSSTEALFASFDHLRKNRLQKQQNHQNNKKIPKMKVPNKQPRQPRYAPFIKVVVKKGAMDYETREFTPFRAAGDPLDINKDWPLDVLEEKLKNMFRGQNLFFEHINGTHVLIGDVENISELITMLRSRNEEEDITVAEVKKSGMFKCQQVGNGTGTHLLIKAAAFPVEEKNIKEELESSIDSNYDLDSFKEPADTVKIKMEHENDVYQSDPDWLPDTQERFLSVNVKRSSDESEADSDKDYDALADPKEKDVSVTGIEADNLATQVVEVKSEVEDIKCEPEDNRRNIKFNPQINGIVAEDGHYCALSPHLINGVLGIPNLSEGEKIVIDRKNPLQSSNDAYLKLKKDNRLEENIFYSFEGEMGKDFGGLTREALTLLISEVKKSNLLSGDETLGFTFVPNYGMAEYFESIGYFMFKASTLSSVYPLLPNLAIAMITEKNLPQDDDEWMDAFKQYPTVNGSELLYNLVALDQYGLETLKENELNIYLSLRNISKLVMKDEDFRPGQKKKIISQLFKYEVTGSQLWMWASIRKGIEKTGFMQLQKEHPSVLSVYSVEMSAFAILTAEDFNSKFQFEFDSTEDEDAIEESKRHLWRCLRALEDGVPFQMGENTKTLKLHDLCVYLTGSLNLLCASEVGVSFSRNDYQFFKTSTCSRSLIIPLGLTAVDFEYSLFEKLNDAGGFSMA